VSFGVLTIGKKKQSSMESCARASWGAAVLRPYMEGADHAMVDGAGALR
jgi:hypothetical protein